jgi:hypothetical protein
VGADNSWVRVGRLLWVVGAVLAAVAAVTLPGGASAAAASKVEVRDVRVDTRGGIGAQFGGRVDVTVRFRVVNTGSQPITPTARVKLESQIGGGTTSAPLALEPIEAGEHVDVVRTAGSLLPFGSAHVVVTVRTDDHVTTATASTPVIPWLLVVGAVVVLLAVFGVWRLRRSRRA